ncbi:hypothetical protein FSARC_4183 [Fusarium sarcochroum]|uniref:Uncharacterized protein n=1 Tax=Fusarium sarcochroum TaxID=1208366 RepID=A0A8H4XBQ5_9HYPO|nr:hypothetical protein FSARC_4183 [Fusarium sarcochroum]
MHLILAANSYDYLKHAQQAVHLFTEEKAKKGLTNDDRERLTEAISHAQQLVDQARKDKAVIDGRTKALLDYGLSKDEVAVLNLFWNMKAKKEFTEKQAAEKEAAQKEAAEKEAAEKEAANHPGAFSADLLVQYIISQLNKDTGLL